MSRKIPRKYNGKRCEYCGEDGFYWTKTPRGYRLAKNGRIHNCLVSDEKGEPGTRASHIPDEPPVDVEPPSKETLTEYESWAQCQAELKTLLDE